MREIAGPLRRLGDLARAPAPVVGFERPPHALLEALYLAAGEAATATATLALLDAAPRSCQELLEELAGNHERASARAHEVLRSRGPGHDVRLLGVLALALADVAGQAHEAAGWWCRSAQCRPELPGLACALRDAARALDVAMTALPEERAADRARAVNQCVSEGRRLARRARAAALERGDVREVLRRMSAIAAVERALGSCRRAASAVERMSF
jgi:hypothetical protein